MQQVDSTQKAHAPAPGTCIPSVRIFRSEALALTCFQPATQNPHLAIDCCCDGVGQARYVVWLRVLTITQEAICLCCFEKVGWCGSVGAGPSPVVQLINQDMRQTRRAKFRLYRFLSANFWSSMVSSPTSPWAINTGVAWSSAA